MIPASSAAPHAARDVSAEEIARYRAMPYEQYLQTGHWRLTRNRALKRAGYHCAKCSSGRNLQVHHLTYEHLGAELDGDLEVLCRGCHLGLHVHETKQGLGVYVKLISGLITAGDFESVADLTEAAKAACARAKLPYYDGQIHAALALLDSRLTFGPMPEKYRELVDVGRPGQPLTHAEACGLIAQFSAQGLMKPMPTVRKMTQRQADRTIALRQIAALLVDQVAVCEAAEAVVERGLPTGAL